MTPFIGYGGYGDNNDNKRWDDHQPQKVDIPPEEKKKNWWDLDDDRKRQLEVSIHDTCVMMH